MAYFSALLVKGMRNLNRCHFLTMYLSKLLNFQLVTFNSLKLTGFLIRLASYTRYFSGYSDYATKGITGQCQRDGSYSS
jgi:hypothetical protein